MATRALDHDPRRDADNVDAARDIRPAVRVPRAGLSTGAIVGGAIVAAILLFGVLDARRRAASAPAVTARIADLPGSDAPPLLYVPPAPSPVTAFLPVARPIETPAPRVPPPSPPPPPQIAYAPPPQPVVAQPAPPLRVAGGAALVIDTGLAEPGAVSRSDNGGATVPQRATASAAPRAQASVIANRSATVPQGTLIPAVLETAFDSTRPGFARALVQRDVHGFDGTRVLVPRGSRLIGEYGAETSAGQNRAVIAWTRLIRPDGVSIALASPAADPVGRGGIKASVNSHFLARFSGAILQSVLDVGVNLASRSANSPVIVALPGSVGTSASQLTQTRQIPPTLTVPQGRSISVFVARDLDFSDAGQER